MKRRKKLWIACAALAVVIVLCVLSLTNKPPPHLFLRTAKFEGSDSSRITLSTGEKQLYEFREYKVEGTLGDVLADAQKELTAGKGWTWWVESDQAYGWVDKSGHGVTIKPEPGRSFDGKPFMIVTTQQPATQAERLWLWLNGI